VVGGAPPRSGTRTPECLRGRSWGGHSTLLGPVCEIPTSSRRQRGDIVAEFTSEVVPLSKLLLDPNNYRFQDEPDFVFAQQSRFAEDSVQARASRRLRDEGLVELKNSILKNGFLPVERIVVTPYEHAEEKYLVLEGNRRVAALRWMSEDHQAGVAASAEVLSVLDAVPF
jgi:hypothetical protein